VAKERPEPTGPGEDEDQGSWFLRSGGAWVFALALWLAGVGGIVVFARDGAEVAMARWFGTPGTVTIDTCAHTKNYALCYGPFESSNGSVRIKRLELRTLHHDQPGRQEKTWLRSRSATHAWASDVNPWTQLIPVLPFALLGIIQTVWLTLSWRAWRRRRRLRRRERALGPPAAASPVSPPPAPSPALSLESAPTAAYPLLPPGPYPPAATTSGHLPPGAQHVPEPATVYPPEPSGANPPGPTAGYQPATGRAQPPGGAEPPAPGVYRSRPPRVEYTQPPARRPPATGAVDRPGHRPGDRIDDRPGDRRGDQFGDEFGDQFGERPGAEDGRRAGWQDRQGPAAPPGHFAPQAPPDQFAPPAPPLRARRPHRERPEHG
jgi:hypothetical protein